ncbi:MAG: hypothetical protein ACI8UR_002268 [Natronomonas sp.]
MFIAFRDANGQVGTVTQELTVRYEGKWAAEVERYVSEVRSDHRGADGEVATAAAFDQLVIELPEKAPITTIERQSG